MHPPHPSPKPPRWPLLLWLCFHAGLPLALLLSSSLGLPPLAVETNLMGLLPPSLLQQGMAEAETLFGQRHSQNFVVLVGSPHFSHAKTTATQLYERLQGRLAPPRALFEELSLFVDENAVANLAAFLHEYRYVLLDKPTTALLQEGKAQTLANEALSWAYGAFHVGGLSYLEEDPFLLAERALRGFLNFALSGGGALSLQEGVLAAPFEGKHYVLLRGRLGGEGVAMGPGGGVEEIYRICAQLSAETPSLHFAFSGIPFHSYESASKAQREIALLSGLTLLLLLLLFLWVFRSPLPVAAIGFCTALSLLMGACAAFLLFRRVHILSFQLGLCLIGLSVDYAIHFFVKHRAGLLGSGGGSGAPGALGGVLLRGISICFASSFACFLIFLWAPFEILRQFALFSALGLLSAYLTTLCLFPRVIPRRATPSPQGYTRAPKWGALSPKTSRALLGGLVVCFLGAIGVGRSHLKIENNLRSLYAASPSLLEAERVAAALLGHNMAHGFLLWAPSLEALLEREEAFLASLEEGGAPGYWGASRFIPSIKTQKAHYEAAAALLVLAEAQYEALGVEAQKALLLQNHYAAFSQHYALPSAMPPLLAGLVSNLLVEEPQTRRWYSMVLPPSKPGPSVVPKERLAALAQPYAWVAMQNKAEDISAALDSLTATLLGLLGLALGGVVLGVGFYYGTLHKTLRVAATPVFAGLACLAMHALLGLPISFFSLTGFILVLGLGLDYMLYFNEEAVAAPGHGATTWAVILSYATTALSFAALAFSSFAPLRLVALAVLSGLSAAFCWAMLVKR